MKKRIWKKIAVLGVAALLTGMISENVRNAESYVHAEDVKAEIDGSLLDEEVELDTVETEGEELMLLDDSEEYGADEKDADDGADTNENNAADFSSEADADETESPDLEAKLIFTAEAESVVKAGSDLVYTLQIENTGDLPLENLRIQYLPGQEDMDGEWSGALTEQAGDTAYMEYLDAGMRKTLYLTVIVPEEQEEAVAADFGVTAVVKREAEQNPEEITETANVKTEITPLKISYEVTKTADRSAALPGDQIFFQICIRNTGERTLHSVVTTERFQLQNVPVEFLPQEGVVLNNTKTKARIDAIEPGKAAGLEAVVTLPENLEAQELLNEVTVTTKETGEQVITSQARIEVRSVAKAETETGNEETTATTHAESRTVTHNPKTGDASHPVVWILVLVGALLVIFILYFLSVNSSLEYNYHWQNKEK